MKQEKLTKLLLTILLLACLTFELAGCKDKQSETEQAEVSSEEGMESSEEPILELPIGEEKTVIEQEQLPDEPNQ